MTKVKLDLCVSPHFFSPQDSKTVPLLVQIVNGLLRKELDIVALTSCHTATSGIDHRFFDYMKQLNEVAWRYNHINYNHKQGLLEISDRDRRLLLIHTQKVRAYEGDMPAYLNIFGLGEIIEPTRDITETAREAKDKGAVVLVPDPNSKSCASLEKSLELYESGLADGIQVSATEEYKKNQRLIAELEKKGVKAFPSSNAKHYRDAGTSYAEMDLSTGFELGEIGRNIRKGNFAPHYGQINLWQRFWSRDIHIIASGPRLLIAGGKRAAEYLKVVFGRRK